nr:vesicle transport protein SEC20-like isoform X2 [Paramormyrops kingsleyae]
MAAPTDPRVPLIRSDLELKAFIRDIRKFPESHEELMDLNSKVKEKITELRLRIQDLEQTGKEQDKESERLAMLSEAEGYRKRLLRDQTTWRKANLACRMAIDRRQQEELFRGSDVPLRLRKMTKASVAQTAGHMTECLMSVTRMMSQQVKMSEETIGTLENRHWSSGGHLTCRSLEETPCWFESDFTLTPWRRGLGNESSAP